LDADHPENGGLIPCLFTPGALKEVVAELVLENRLLKKSTLGAGEDGA
jgi:hypothetical protein